MRILDVFCCQGGAAVGYARAFPDALILGIDIECQPLYPFDFFQTDAMRLLDVAAAETEAGRPGVWDLIHASPPCQRYSDLANRNGNGDAWPDLIGPVRDLLQRIGVPYVIENVPEAPLHGVTLCGTMFPELRVLRHRVFETSFPCVAPPHPKHPLVFTHDKRKPHYGQLDQDTSFVQVTGGGNATIANKRAAMGMPWATNHGLNEAIPPAYCEWIGNQFALTARTFVH